MATKPRLNKGADAYSRRTSTDTEEVRTSQLFFVTRSSKGRAWIITGKPAPPFCRSERAAETTSALRQVKPHPQHPIHGRTARTAKPLTTHVTERDQLQLQFSTAPKPASHPRVQRRDECEYPATLRAPEQNRQIFRGLRSFQRAQVVRLCEMLVHPPEYAESSSRLLLAKNDIRRGFSEAAVVAK